MASGNGASGENGEKPARIARRAASRVLNQ
jgi:hypothetical protein